MFQCVVCLLLRCRRVALRGVLHAVLCCAALRAPRWWTCVPMCCVFVVLQACGVARVCCVLCCVVLCCVALRAPRWWTARCPRPGSARRPSRWCRRAGTGCSSPAGGGGEQGTQRLPIHTLSKATHNEHVLSEERETTMHLCGYSEDVHRTKWQALTIARLTHSPYTTEIARLRRYTMLKYYF